MNASVEAARAGQHGAGFKIVAQEVRRLAGRSAEASQEARNLIDNGTTFGSAGNEIAAQVAQEFEKIQTKIVELNSAVTQIVSASQSEKTEAHDISLGVDKVSQDVTATASASEQIAASAASLSADSQTLVATIETFRATSNSMRGVETQAVFLQELQNNYPPCAA